MADTIQGLWVGPRLSAMERMCISSFLRNGHPFHLYVYQDTEGIPEGTIVLDGNLILPAARIFRYEEHETYAGFANFFRYKLLLEKGGWWVDTDTICVKPFDFPEDYVFSSEGSGGGPVVNVGALKVPAGSPVMRYAWEACGQMNTGELKWGECGPALAGKAIEACTLQKYVQPPEAFCPVHFSEWERTLDPAARWTFGEGTHAIHLWNELWRRSNQDKDATYPAGCLYEQLKEQYLARHPMPAATGD